MALEVIDILAIVPLLLIFAIYGSLHFFGGLEKAELFSSTVPKLTVAYVLYEEKYDRNKLAEKRKEVDEFLRALEIKRQYRFNLFFAFDYRGRLTNYEKFKCATGFVYPDADFAKVKKHLEDHPKLAIRSVVIPRGKYVEARYGMKRLLNISWSYFFAVLKCYKLVYRHCRSEYEKGDNTYDDGVGPMIELYDYELKNGEYIGGSIPSMPRMRFLMAIRSEARELFLSMFEDRVGETSKNA